jgi:hypothetical protein
MAQAFVTGRRRRVACHDHDAKGMPSDGPGQRPARPAALPGARLDDYYLDHYLNGMDWWQASELFGLDYAIYVEPTYVCSSKDAERWRVEHPDLGHNTAGDALWSDTVTTPKRGTAPGWRHQRVHPLDL